MAGAEAVSILRRNFSGDAHFGEKIIPVRGLWADNSFLSIFSFPMLEGNPGNALAEPYSIVLTEQTSKKIFGIESGLGKIVTLDTTNYVVTGILKDIPEFSHIKFEALGSFSTFDIQNRNNDRLYGWTSMWMNYVYVLLPDNGKTTGLQANLNNLAKVENTALEYIRISLWLQPMSQFVLGPNLSNNDGANVDPVILWIVGALAFVVMLSAAFNYTNLSIARSIRRGREVGVRKVIGANRGNVIWQFISESIVISLLALLLSAGVFILLRNQFLTIDPELLEIVSLKISPGVTVGFILLAIFVGFISGILPAIFFSRISPVKVLKNAASIKGFRHLNFRKALIAIQYTVSLMFITAAVIGFNQYKHSLAFNLGFTTDNILNVRLQGNGAAIMRKEFNEIPEITRISGSNLVPSIGNFWSASLKYQDPNDSIFVYFVQVDENYIPLHDHKLIAGRNYIGKSGEFEESEIIINEKTLERFNIAGADPYKAIGEYMKFDGKDVVIIGVIKDFHYGKIDTDLLPVIFRYSNDQDGYSDGYLNLKINSTNLPGTMAKIENAWKKVDTVHPLNAKFYSEQIENAYGEYSAMVKVIGYLAFLAITIASMGLFGMVVFTTESRQKEIGIRKALGAGILNIMYLLSRGFLILVGFASVIALPATYLFFEKIFLSKIPYHSPIGFTEIFLGLGIVGAIALLMIGSQTYKIARVNPSTVLKSE
jgi:ABC-type antimicrobial peptide transport system permease subunit